MDIFKILLALAGIYNLTNTRFKALSTGLLFVYSPQTVTVQTVQKLFETMFACVFVFSSVLDWSKAQHKLIVFYYISISFSPLVSVAAGLDNSRIRHIFHSG